MTTKCKIFLIKPFCTTTNHQTIPTLYRSTIVILSVPGWWQYDERTSQDIEEAYQKKENTVILVAGHLYMVDFEGKNMLLINNRIVIYSTIPSTNRHDTIEIGRQLPETASQARPGLCPKERGGRASPR